MSSFASALSAAPSIVALAALDIIVNTKTSQREQKRAFKKGAAAIAFDNLDDKPKSKGKFLLPIF